MNVLRVAWLAGLTDGDGCITAYWQSSKRWKVWRPVWRLQLSCLKTVKAAQAIVRELTGRNYKIQQYQPPGNTKLTYGIQVQRKAAALKLLETLEPFLVTKQEQARLVTGLLRHEQRYRDHPRRSDPETLAFADATITTLRTLNFRGIPSQAPDGEGVENRSGTANGKVCST